MSIDGTRSVCDVPGCGWRSREYQAWPICRGCQRHTCPEHADPTSYHEQGGHLTVRCWQCIEATEAA